MRRQLDIHAFYLTVSSLESAQRVRRKGKNTEPPEMMRLGVAVEIDGAPAPNLRTKCEKLL